MFRSLTFSEDLDNWKEDEKFRGRHFVLLFGFFFVEFFLSSTFFYYGIILFQYTEDEFYCKELGLWTMILYVASSSISKSWGRSLSDYLNDQGSNIFKIFICITTFTMILSIFLTNLYTNYLFHIVTFGVLGGTSSSLLTVYLKYIVNELVDLNTFWIDGIQQAARALSLFLIPQITALLLSYYDTFETQYIFGTLIAHVIPAAFLINTSQKKVETLSRYKSFPIFKGNMTELSDLTSGKIEQVKDDTDEESLDSNSSSGNSYELELEPQQSTEELPSADENLTIEEKVQSYYKSVGVSILPQITEENEDDINSIHPKRLSRISTRLEELNQNSKPKSLSRDSLIFKSTPQIDKIDENELESGKSFLKDMKKMKRKSCCSPYSKYRWRRRYRRVSGLILDNFLKPLSSAVKNVYFYPSLISKVSINLVSTIFISLVPYMVMAKSVEENLEFSLFDAACLLSYMAFSWSLVLIVGIPVLGNSSSANRKRFAFILGFVISAFSMILHFYKFSNDILILNSMAFGCGFGIVNYVSTIVYRSYIGVQHWKKVQGTLDILSAIFVILIYGIIYYFKFNQNVLLYLAFGSYILNAILWIITPIFKHILDTIKNRFFNHSDDIILY